MSARACLGLPGEACGKITTHGSRCPEHERRYRTMMSARRRDPELDLPTSRAARGAAVAAWVEEHGWVCPGWRRKPHPAKDLTADHRVSRAKGGRTEPGNLDVLCRSCNGRKGAQDPDATQQLA